MTLALPTVATMLSYTLMQFTDAIMVAQVGPEEVAAQGNGGIWAFAFMAFLFGALTVVNTFISQALGARRNHEVARYSWAGIWFAILSWALLLVPIGLLLPLLFGLMGHEPRVTELETAYAEVLVFGGLVVLLGKALSNIFFGLHRPMVITVAALVGNAVNLSLNYVLIYGAAGLQLRGEDGDPWLDLPGVPGVPAMGLVGAGLATVAGTAVEGLIPAWIFLSRRMHATYGTRTAWRPDWKALRNLVRVGAPAGLQTGNEVFTWAVFMSVLMGVYGTVALAAGWIALRYMHLAFMPALGFGVATTSIVGRYIGAGQRGTAAHRVRVALTVSMTYMGLCGVGMLLFRETLLGFFAYGANTDPDVAAQIVLVGGPIMVAAAFFQAFDALGIVLISALRGAGDTFWPGVLTVGLSWLLIVGLGWVFVRGMPDMGPLGPWIAAGVYIVVLGCSMALRWRSGAWRRIQLLDRDVPAG